MAAINAAGSLAVSEFFVAGLRRARRKVERNDRDVVRLTESLRRLRDVARDSLLTCCVRSNPNNSPSAVRRFHHAVGKKDEPVAAIQLKSRLLVLHIRNHSQRQTPGSAISRPSR